MRRFIAVLALLFLSSAAAAEITPATIETGWNYGFFYQECTNVTACVADLTAANPTNKFTGLGAGVSVSSLNVVGFSWTVLSVGANSTFTISQLIHAAPPINANPASTSANYNAPTSGFNDSGHQTSWPAPGAANVISTTTAIVALAGIPLNGTFQAMTTNPYFKFSGLTAAASTYIWAEVAYRKY